MLDFRLQDLNAFVAILNFAMERSAVAELVTCDARDAVDGHGLQLQPLRVPLARAFRRVDERRQRVEIMFQVEILVAELPSFRLHALSTKRACVRCRRSEGTHADCFGDVG